MNAISGLKFDPLGIGTILKGEVLRVPPYQREYSWSEDQVEDLFRDIADSIADDRPSYFLGTIVFNSPEDQSTEVVDGQQRLATTMILLAAFRDYMVKENELEFAKSIDDDFLFRYERRSRDFIPKLSLNVDDNAYFTSRILHRPNAKQRRECPPPKLSSHRLIEGAANIAADRVKAIVHGSGNRDARINDWLDYLQHKSVVLVLRVPTEMDAFKLFETLNDRGLPTTQADLLKNFLFRQSGTSGMIEAQKKWSSMRSSLESLGVESVTLTYLRHVTLVVLGPTQEKLGFYDRLEKEFKGKAKSLAFLDSLARYADDYSAILTPTHSKWNSYPGQITEAISTMRDLGVAQIRPLMLAVATNFSPKDAEQAFRAFVCWTVRFLIVGGMRGQALEDAYASRAHKIAIGEIKSFAALRESMKSGDVVPNDVSFETEFAAATVSRPGLARYYLRALEATERNETDYPEVMPIQDPNILNLEHILPQNPEANWPHITPEIAAAHSKRIGNLVLINAKKNSLAGNLDFSKKRLIFKDSAISLTRRVFEKTKSSTVWGPDEIVARQEQLAKLAVKTWPI